MTTVVSTMGQSDSTHELSPSWQSWVVVFAASLFFFYEFMVLNMFNAINAALLKEFQISAAELGQVSAYYFYANLCFLLPAGIILDRFSTRRVILIMMTLCVISTLMFSFAHHIWVAKCCRFIMGVGGSFILLAPVRLASRWFPAQRMALVVGLIVTFAMLGGMVSQTPMTMLTESFGWHKTLQFTAISGVVMLAIIYFCVKDYPANYQDTGSEAGSELPFWVQLRGALTNAQNWLGGLYTSLMNLPIFLLGAMWGTMYLAQLHHITRTHASWITTMIFFGTVIGSPVLGWYSDKIGLRRQPMLVCAIISFVLLLALMFVPNMSIATLMVLFFAIGFFTSAQIISYPLVAESNPKAITGMATGIASVLIMAGGISQPIFGWLMGLHWNHKLAHGVPIYSLMDYDIAMAMMPIAFVVAFVAAYVIKETYCKARD